MAVTVVDLDTARRFARLAATVAQLGLRGVLASRWRLPASRGAVGVCDRAVSVVGD
jgi:hypothetical protein